MDTSHGLCVILLLGWVRACQHSPGISIAPLQLEGLAGSCLLIPCHFKVNDGENYTGLQSRAVWIMKQSQYIVENSAFVIFNKTRTVGKNWPMEFTGDLKSKDCTTVFNDLIIGYTEKYFFRVEDGEFRSTASCDPIDITVRDSPWSPSVEVSGEQTEAEVVTITCTAVTPCPENPPELTWILDLQKLKDPGHNLVKNVDGTFNTTITHKLTLTSSHNGSNLTCSAAYPVNRRIYAKNKAQTTIIFNMTRRESVSGGHVMKWMPAVGVIVLIALISGIVYIWCVKFRRRYIQPPQVEIIEEVVHQDPDQIEDGLHYGDLSFCPGRASPVAHAQEDTVYSQVKASNNQRRQATEMKDIYANVNR